MYIKKKLKATKKGLSLPLGKLKTPTNELTTYKENRDR